MLEPGLCPKGGCVQIQWGSSETRDGWRAVNFAASPAKKVHMVVAARKAVIPTASCGGLTVLTSNTAVSSGCSISTKASPSAAVHPPQVGVQTPGATEGS